MSHDGQRDFDFIVGNWKSYNRRLKARLKGSTEWEEFEGHFTGRLILDGVANMDEVTFYRETGPMQGYTLRLYDPAAQEWRIYWASNLTTVLDVPMIGKFEDGYGKFYAQEQFEGKTIFSRYIWQVNSPTSCHWEQAFSTDGGATWETNWTMDFTKED